MNRFFTLSSSSAGNSYYLGNEDGGILIDCGTSCRTAEKSLSSNGIDPDSLYGIVITHEHSDHIKGLNVFLSKHSIPVYASEAVIKVLVACQNVPDTAKLVPIDENGTVIGPFLVSPFHISHDSVGGYGYSVTTSDGRKITTCTDTGHLSDEAVRHLCGSSLVLLESNYEKVMLEAGRYPYPLKVRIEGPQGHLSNDDCAGILPELVRKGTKHIILAHLSKENNTPDMALNSALYSLSMAGFKRDSDYTLEVAPRSGCSDVYEV